MPGHSQEIRNVLTPPGGGLRSQPEWLRDHVSHIAREIQRQQEPLLFQALEPVMPAGEDQELQARPVPLTRPPGEMTPWLTAGSSHDLTQVAHRAVGHRAVTTPADLPPRFPARAARQLPPCCLGDLVNVGEIRHTARAGRDQRCLR
jgi:hypothetical protein